MAMLLSVTQAASLPMSCIKPIHERGLLRHAQALKKPGAATCASAALLAVQPELPWRSVRGAFRGRWCR